MVVVVSFGVFVLGFLPLFRLAGVVGSDNPAVEFELKVVEFTVEVEFSSNSADKVNEVEAVDV